MKILVLALQGLGDSLEVTPMLSALKLEIHDAHITVATTRGVATSLFQELPELVDRVVELPYWDKGLQAFALAAVREILYTSYDIAFLPYPAARPEYTILLRMFRARKRYAHTYRAGFLQVLLGLGITAGSVRKVHNVHRNADLLGLAGLQPDLPDRYQVPRAWKSADRAPNLILMHGGTVAHDGLENRRWAPERFASVATSLLDRGYDVQAICGPSDEDAVGAILALEERVGVLRGRLDEVARKISTARLLIANDSGIAHLAAGVGTPVVALFGPTPLEHAPFAPNAVSLRPSSCPPCFDVRLLNTECARNIDFQCLKQDLPAALVEETILSILST